MAHDIREKSPPKYAARSYRVGHTYDDKGRVKDERDQFCRWLRIKNVGGIRKSTFKNLKRPTKEAFPPAFLVLVSVERGGSFHNPWQDSVDHSVGEIVYWGDAKFDERKRVNDFPGNLDLILATRLAQESRSHCLVPPILHFSKSQTGKVTFNGLCVIDRLELAWFYDENRPVQNFKATLTILDTAEIDSEWLTSRANARSIEDLQDIRGPEAWEDFRAGRTRRLIAWRPQIRSKSDQMPISGTIEAAALHQLHQLPASKFERATVVLLQSMDSVVHSVTQTRLSRDGGFDFFGQFRFPNPLTYEINFRGEAKRYGPNVSVGAKDVSRLAARLNRGEYGLFITTSYFSEQSQAEVYGDGYPVHLIAGRDLTRILLSQRVISDNGLDPNWVATLGH